MLSLVFGLTLKRETLPSKFKAVYQMIHLIRLG